MNEEIPYNPTGLDDYIRDGARKNSALLRKMRGEPGACKEPETHGGSLNQPCSPPLIGLLVTCCRCGTPLMEPGALMFAPPNKSNESKKYHFCVTCFKRIVAILAEGNK